MGCRSGVRTTLNLADLRKFFFSGVAVMLLFLLCAVASDDYVALKKFYESTFGSGWQFNTDWDMSNTDVCTWGYYHAKVT